MACGQTFAANSKEMLFLQRYSYIANLELEYIENGNECFLLHDSCIVWQSCDQGRLHIVTRTIETLVTERYIRRGGREGGREREEARKEGGREGGRKGGKGMQAAN